MLRRIVLAAAAAGVLAGLLLTLVQHWQVIPLIREAETYEAGTAAAAAKAGAAVRFVAEAAGGGWARAALALLMNVAVGIGGGLVLSALIALRGGAGWREGLIWGGAAFAALSLAPALGLPPELPGAVAAGLPARQLWWLAAAASTAVGLALLAFARPRLVKAAGALALAVPHAIGAPAPGGGAGLAPPELVARFAVASLFAAAVFWVALGALCGHFWRRLGRS
ncbi:MAG: CbtA family protein [Proteobacteria bacterium]|nr:CbtA family protein [Pseudomonadota bacterium]